jgi:hypothetical protein
VLITIIVDPTAPVYPFEARRPPTRMPLALHCCNKFNAAPAASFNRSCFAVRDLESIFRAHMLKIVLQHNPLESGHTLFVTACPLSAKRRHNAVQQ